MINDKELVSFPANLIPNSRNQSPVGDPYTNAFGSSYRINNSGKRETFIGCSLDGSHWRRCPLGSAIEGNIALTPPTGSPNDSVWT